MKGVNFTTCALAICLFFSVAHAQSPLSIAPYAFENILDTVVFRVGYRLTYVSDITRANHKKTQELELLLGKRYEQFRVDTQEYDKAYSTPKGSEPVINFDIDTPTLWLPFATIPFGFPAFKLPSITVSS